MPARFAAIIRESFTGQNLVRVQDSDFSIAWAWPDAPLTTLEDIGRGRKAQASGH